MSEDDRELLERIQRGDGESFGKLYDRTRGWLLSLVIVPRVGRADAEDVLAETFRVALEHVRRRGPRLDPLEDLPSMLDVPDDAPTAEAEMIRKETLLHLRERVSRTLAGLHPRYAEALRLRLLEGRARQECAERLSVATATFDVILYRATRAFAREWERP